MHIFYIGIIMEIHCHRTGICDSPMSSSLFRAFLCKCSKCCYSYPHDKFHNFVQNAIDICTIPVEILKIMWRSPLTFRRFFCQVIWHNYTCVIICDNFHNTDAQKSY